MNNTTGTTFFLRLHGESINDPTGPDIDGALVHITPQMAFNLAFQIGNLRAINLPGSLRSCSPMPDVYPYVLITNVDGMLGEDGECKAVVGLTDGYIPPGIQHMKERGDLNMNKAGIWWEYSRGSGYGHAETALIPYEELQKVAGSLLTADNDFRENQRKVWNEQAYKMQALSNQIIELDKGTRERIPNSLKQAKRDHMSVLAVELATLVLDQPEE